MAGLRVLVPLMVVLLIGGPAAAQTDSAAAEARRHFEEGSKAFSLGEFQRAVTEYKAGFNLKPDPVFLYNIAQAYRLAGDLANSLFFYRSYLRNDPTASNRKEVERRIHELDQQLAQQRALSTAPPTSPVAPGGARGEPAATAPPPP
jgi:hypothetical protein